MLKVTVNDEIEEGQSIKMGQSKESERSEKSVELCEHSGLAKNYVWSRKIGTYFIYMAQ